jgi:quercetin dioxygenase-like cupin family protein
VIRWSDLFLAEAVLIQDPSAIGETLISASAREVEAGSPPGVDLQIFVSGACGATGFSTGIARFKPGAFLPYHSHRFSEAITILQGQARILVEGRAYRLQRRDCVHIPTGVAHLVLNDDPTLELVAHWVFATAAPGRELTRTDFQIEERGDSNPSENDPETVVRFHPDAVYELAPNAFFIDLFARRFGAVGICGGHGRFLPGASLPCHIHDFDESITIVGGRAVCLVQGRRYQLSGCDTAFIPRGIPHRFLNQSEGEMEMIWVYSGSEPDRRIVTAGYCSGELAWHGAEAVQEAKQ